MSLILNFNTMQDLWWNLLAQFMAAPTTLAADITQGQLYTQIKIASMPVSLSVGEWVQLGDQAGYITQQVQLAQPAAQGATTLNVNSFTADFGFATGATVLPLDSNQVSNSWQSEGSPAWSINNDICFLRLTTQDSPLSETVDEIWGASSGTTMTVSQSSQRAWLANLLWYGPHAGDNASAFRDWVRTPKVKDWLNNTALSLGGGGLAVIPKIGQPLRGAELYNGQWWNRWTLSFRAYELVQRDDNTVPFVAQPGAIRINTSN